MPAMPANLVPIGSAGDDGLGSAADAESAQQQAEELRLHMETIRSRLKLERDFEGIDPFSIGDSEGDVERAMEMGVLPLQMITDYVRDMFELARLRALGHPLPLWVVRYIEAALTIQRHWRKHKSKLFKGHKYAVNNLFTPETLPPPTWDKTMTQLLEQSKEALGRPSVDGRHWNGRGDRRDWEGRQKYLSKTPNKWNM